MSTPAEDSDRTNRRPIRRKDSGSLGTPTVETPVDDVPPILGTKGAGSLRSGSSGSDILIRPFMVCLALGLILALFSQVRGFEAIGVLGPIALTAAYPAWGYIRGIEKRPSLRERFADNAYYLGFIFTQLALFIGFVPPALMSRSITSTDVLRAFGVAIGASMAGLIARTLIVQTGHTTSENADILEQEVENVAREVETLARGVSKQTLALLEELDAVGSTLAAARRSLGVELGSWVAETAATLKSYDQQLKLESVAVIAGTRAVGQAAENAAANIEGGQSLLVDSIRQSAAALNELQSNLQSQVAEALKVVTSTAHAFSAGATVADQAQQTMREGMVSASENLRVIAGSLDSAGRMFGEVDALKQSVTALAGQISTINGSVGQLSETIERTSGSVAKAESDAVSAVAALSVSAQEDAARRIETFDAQLRSAAQALETVLANFRSELQQVRV